MEQPSVTYSATQSVDYLDQTHKWTNTDVISSYKEICKQFDIIQEKLREEVEQKEEVLRIPNNYLKKLPNNLNVEEWNDHQSLMLPNGLMLISVKFVKRTDQSDYVKIVDKGGYWFCVGRQGKDQELLTKDLQNYPHLEGNIVHELFGFYHEHCRLDRDKYLTVIAKENDRDFGKVCEMDVVYFGPYDPESTMYYFPGCYPQG
ncbi:hypothetical protein RhiirA5_465513 [Rhizophagus irregularis]|uniref:Uncharacterized protein n=1 Tax=Rhizophagus irregularis TaxID=588596 RepID=A0A2I1E7D0_9GLOM|nr:hypothetical protein RhiirA5_465513 [Rhizophagus irregularis]PKY18021.1 hypothetical protein RhiirB3_489816 [Rhizophagus irregularis]